MTESRSRVRVALVGLGGHGKTIQTACMQANSLDVVSVFDIDAGASKEAADRFECPVALSYEALIRQDDIDAVILVTPNHLHRQQVESALNAGKHVFVEKPIANTIVDGLAMIQKAEAVGLVLMVGHHMRFGRAARMARDLIDDGRLGDIVSTELHFSSDTAFHLPPDSWRLKPEHCPLLPVMQLAVHGFDLVHYLVGPIEEVFAAARSMTTVPGVVDSVAATYRIEGGSMGTMVSNYCSPTLFECRIAGTTGMLRLMPDSLRLCTAGSVTGNDETLEFDGNEAYTFQMEAFGRSVRDQAVPETDGWAGLKALAVVEAILRSAIEKTPRLVQRFDGAGTMSAARSEHRPF